MASRTIPVAELRSLLAAVSEHGEQHLIEVETDLMQTTFLLAEAIEKLGDSFMQIHEAVTAQQLEINTLLQVAKLPADHFQKILQEREKVASHVDAAVTSLQFQDMTNQLITRTINRVNGLRESLAALAVHGQEMDPQHEHEEIAHLLDAMSASLSARNDVMKHSLRKAVAQKSMTSGEVELF